MLSGGCESPLGTPLLLFLLPGRQPAPAQALQPAGWVLFINSCPRSEHGGEEGIFQLLFPAP